MPVITNPITNVPSRPKSHSAGWAKKWADLLDAEIAHSCQKDIVQSADTVYIEHGANFGGTLNLFGGATDELVQRIDVVRQCSNVVSLDHEMPNYGEQLRKRMNAKTTSPLVTNEWCDEVSEWCKEVPSYTMEQLWKDRDDISELVVGDSHSIAFAPARAAILRNDGLTARRGILKFHEDNGLLRGCWLRPTDRITFCFGSIDVRHHLLRDGAEPFPIKEYHKLVHEVADDCQFQVCAPVPVEHEGRRLPKTGYYKGTPFTGSREQRLELTHNITGLLESTFGPINVVCPPYEWYTMPGERYAQTIMEMGGSVHIAPPYYRANNWGEQ